VIILPQRQTALVAKQAAEVDLLSGGRLRLGVGLGWNAVEYQALKEDFTTRGRRIGEQIAVMRQLWTQEVVSFEGRWHQIDRAGIRPRPVQRPIPVWMGGMSAPALKRIARVADGWMPNARRMSDLEALMETMRGHLRDNGREGAFGFEARLEYREGGLDYLLATTESFRNLGMDYMGLNTMGAGLASPRDHIETIRKFKESIS
jgi:probable F420-dependent oxidoreductase